MKSYPRRFLAFLLLLMVANSHINRKLLVAFDYVLNKLHFFDLPAFMLSPSIMAASISTWPIMVSLEPRPALKAASSSITETAATTASKTLPELQFFRF